METAVPGTDMAARLAADAGAAMAQEISTALGGGPLAAAYLSYLDARYAGKNVVGTPNARTISFATAYQATDPARACFFKALLQLATTVGVGSPSANTVELVVGPTSAVASGTGDVADRFRQDINLTLISLQLTAENAVQALVPAGHYFAVRRTSGTGITILSASDRALG